jgi:hypothetical protein
MVLKCFEQRKFEGSKVWNNFMDDERFELVKCFLQRILREKVRRKGSRAKTFKDRGFTFVCQSEYFEGKSKKIGKNLNLFSQKEKIFKGLEEFCLTAEGKSVIRKIHVSKNLKMFKKERKGLQGD